MTSPTDITQLLIQWSNGDRAALDRLFPLIEKELHRLAHFYMQQIRPGNMLQTTAVINETYLKLLGQNDVKWQNRAHFFGISAHLMRRFLMNFARDQRRLKRGGNAIQVSLSDVAVVSPEKSEELLALDEALIRLEELDPRKCKVVELRYFGGLSVEETAEVLSVSKITVTRDWNMAKAWLAREIRNG
jgi:RNA polymerase sigma factor (TIGR02999 family)